MSQLIFNQDLEAYNVFELDINFEQAFNLVNPLVEELNNTSLYDPNKRKIHLKDMSLPMFVQIPHWNGDISWVSAASKDSFDFFDLCFRTLEIERKTKDIADLDFPLIMYSGFFVVRSYGTKSHYHEDYNKNCGNKAFTIMIPIQLDETEEFGHLLYKDSLEKERKYRYKKSKAITFGSHFIHSTEPYKQEKKSIFLCFTYGTKDLTIWEHIKQNAAWQGVAYRHANGNIIVKDSEFDQYF